MTLGCHTETLDETGGENILSGRLFMGGLPRADLTHLADDFEEMACSPIVIHAPCSSSSDDPEPSSLMSLLLRKIDQVFGSLLLHFLVTVNP